jgi:large subunit ribosomal protein L4
MTSSPDLAWRRSRLPEQPGRELHPEGQQEDVSRRHGAILSQLVRDGRLAVVDSLEVDAPKTSCSQQKFKAMGLSLRDGHFGLHR